MSLDKAAIYGSSYIIDLFRDFGMHARTNGLPVEHLPKPPAIVEAPPLLYPQIEAQDPFNENHDILESLSMFPVMFRRKLSHHPCCTGSNTYRRTVQEGRGSGHWSPYTW
jgi:hypothetical protein